MRRSNRGGDHERKCEADRQCECADQRVQRKSGRRDLVQVGFGPSPARLSGEADDRRADAEIEDREIDRHRTDERPDAEGGLAD